MEPGAAAVACLYRSTAGGALDMLQLLHVCSVAEWFACSIGCASAAQGVSCGVVSVVFVCVCALCVGLCEPWQHCMPVRD